MEILIASAIFAGIMAMTVGTFSWAAGYNNRLHETRRVAQSGRAVLADITTQIRLANGSVAYKKFITDLDPPPKMNEIILLNCSGDALSTCGVTNDTTPTRLTIVNDVAPLNSNTLIILKKDQNEVILYRSRFVSDDNYEVLKQKIDYFAWSSVLILTSGSFANFNPVTQRLSDSNISLKIDFAGFGPKGTKTKQPFVDIFLTGQTKDYSTTNPTNRSKFYLKTLTESRDYN